MNNTIINTVLKYSIITGLSLIAFIPLYVANPLFFPFITGKAFAFRIIVEIIFVLWLVLVFREKGTDIANSEKSVAPKVNYLTIFITAFTFIVLIADLIGYNPLRSIWSNFERMEGWITIVHLWAYFMVMSSIFGKANIEGGEGRKNWRIFLNVMLFSGTITAFYGLFQYFGLAEVHQSASRVDASLGNAAYMAVYMIMNSFIAGYLALVAYKHKLDKKDGALAMIFVYSIIFVLSSFILFQTATRGSIIGWAFGILVACGIYALFGRSKIVGDVERGQSIFSRYFAAGIILFVITSAFALYMAKEVKWVKDNQVLGRLSSISISDTKTQARGYIWPMAVKEIFSSPKTALIGIGQENFNYIFNKNYTPLMFGQEQWFDRAHSVFLDWLVASGLIGLIFYLSFYFFALFYLYKTDLSLGQKCMLIALIVAYGIHNVFVFDNQTSYVMFFTILAMISSMTVGKAYKWLGNSSEKMSEDAIVIRDYIFIPVIVLGFVITIYFVNVRNIQANTRLITALRSCQALNTLSTKTFESVLSLNQTTANQETREQLISCAGNVLSSDQVPAGVKSEFYTFVKGEIEKQISSTPNDARIYVLAGSLINAIGDYKTALPLLEKAKELTPLKQSVSFDLAINYMSSNRPQDAVDITKKAYESATGYETAKFAYIAALINADQEKTAHDLFGNDDSLFADQRIISIYQKKKNYDKVIEIYNKLLVKNPDDPRMRFSLAVAYFTNNQSWLGLKELRYIAEKFPETKTQIEQLIKEVESGKNPFVNVK